MQERIFAMLAWNRHRQFQIYGALIFTNTNFIRLLFSPRLLLIFEFVVVPMLESNVFNLCYMKYTDPSLIGSEVFEETSVLNIYLPTF